MFLVVRPPDALFLPPSRSTRPAFNCEKMAWVAGLGCTKEAALQEIVTVISAPEARYSAWERFVFRPAVVFSALERVHERLPPQCRRGWKALVGDRQMRVEPSVQKCPRQCVHAKKLLGY